MEGMPRLPMLCPDFKYPASPSFPEFSSKIEEYILTHYDDDPTKYNAALSELGSLRAKLCSFFPDTELVCQIKRYYAQLKLAKSRFPMEEKDPIRIPFSWCEKGSDSMSFTYEDVNFELICVMFDIGAIHAAIAAAESRTDSDSIKNAFTHFQCAAYAFQYIRDNMNPSKFSVFDFEPTILTWYVNVLLAQAQECILEKSLLDHRKNTIVAKIATYLKEVYKQCGELLINSCASDVISSNKYKEWLRTCDVKCELYGAVVMLHMGDQAGIEQNMGVRVTYYDVAQKHVASALKYAEKDKRESVHQALSFVQDVVTEKYARAKYDNDHIYCARILKPEELPAVEPVTMVKPIGFDPTDRSVSGDDLFAALLPMNVLRAVSVYTEEKAKFRRGIIEKVDAKNEELEAFMISLHLDEINLDLCVDDMTLPDTLLEKSAAINSQPDAFPELLEKLKKVGDCALEAEGKLTVLHNRLSVIDLPELTSDKGFVAISKELFKITEDHKKARENNTKLQKAIAMHSENLRILALPLSELNRRIGGPVIKPSETAEGAHLKKMLDKADEMKKQREQFLRDLTSDLDNDDITAKCLTEKDFDNEELFRRELKKHEKVVELIEMNLNAQPNILTALTDANASFAACRKQVMELNNSRKDQVLALTAAYEVYCNVLRKANEGLKFYSTLFAMVRTLEGAIEGIEEAYASKKSEVEKAKHAAEERVRKLEIARGTRETLRQFSSESSELCAITSGMCNGRGSGIQLNQNLALPGNAMAGQFQMPSPLPSMGVNSCSSPFSSIATPAQQFNTASNNSMPLGTTPVSLQQRIGMVPTMSGQFPIQPSFSLPPQNNQSNSNASTDNRQQWKQNQMTQNSSNIPSPTSYKQPFNTHRNNYSQLSASQTGVKSMVPSPMIRPETPMTVSSLAGGMPQNYSALDRSRNSFNSFSQNQAMMSPNLPVHSVSNSAAYCSTQNSFSPVFGTVANTVTGQQIGSCIRPQQQMTQLLCNVPQNQVIAMNSGEMLWKQSPIAPPSTCSPHFTSYVQQTNTYRQDVPGLNQFSSSQPMGVGLRPSWQQTRAAIPPQFPNNAVASNQMFGAPQDNVTYVPGTCNGSSPLMQKPFGVTMQPQPMDLMNAPLVSNLPEPLIPLRNVKNTSQ